MLVRMIKTERGSENGYTVETFQAGEVYDLAPSLAEVFVGLDVAEYATAASIATSTNIATAPAHLTEAQADAQAEALETVALGDGAATEARSGRGRKGSKAAATED
jgi:hypothetical protein